MVSSLDTSVRRRWIEAGIVVPAFALVYFLFDFGLNRMAFSHGWTILWPLNGLTIALMIMRPRAEWPAMLLGIEIGIGIGEHWDGNTLLSTVIQRLISLLEVVLSALLLPAFSSLNMWLRKPYIYPRFVGALVVGPGISGVLAAVFFHWFKGQAYFSAFNDWATADGLGIAVTMPLFLSLRSPEMRELFRRDCILKTLAVLTLAFVAADVLFSVQTYPLLFLFFPVLLFVDSLLGFAGAAIAIVVTSIYSVYLATNAIGPFGNWPPGLALGRDLALQIFLGFHMLVLFPASILFMERRRMASELQNTNSQLLMLASLDGLTGIANRRSLDERFTQEWNGAMRVQMPLGLLMIDIDHFKQFNDLYGHHTGDQCLQAVATVLAKEMRRAQDHLARFGGEEFAVLLPHTDADGALLIAEKLRAAVAGLAMKHRGSDLGQVTISIGCAAFTPSHGMDSYVLLEMADSALYQAKRGGRNCVYIERTHSTISA